MTHARIRRPLMKSWWYADFGFGAKYFHSVLTVLISPAYPARQLVGNSRSKRYASQSRVGSRGSGLAPSGENLGQPFNLGFGTLLGDSDEEGVVEVRIPLGERNTGEIAGAGSLSEQ